MKVLVIDDDPVALEVGRGALESLGHTVLTLSSALGASAVVLRERPELVLLDLEMPALSGAEWLRLVRERDLFEEGQEIGFVVHSGGDPDDLARSAQELGAVGVIPKGGRLPDFVAAFQEIAASRAAPEPAQE